MRTKIIPSFVLLINALFFFISCKEQPQNNEKIQDEEIIHIASEKEAVKLVMRNYKDAIQNLTTDGTLQLFTKDASVFESGGSEGTYENYVAHHLGPELGHFNSFTFSDYTIHVEIDMPYAFTTEAYVYTIDLKENKERDIAPRIIKKKGVTTSDLKKIDGKWKIVKLHSSSRDIRKAP